MLFDFSLIEEMWEHRIFLSPNPPKPKDGDTHYGWLQIGAEIKFQSKVILEERVGLYGGAYVGSVGAPGFPGFSSLGSFSYSFSPLPEKMKVGRYTSISSGLKILDSHHNLDRLTTSALYFRPHNFLFSDVINDSVERIDQHWDIYGGLDFPVVENDVWIGRDVTLKMGVTINSGSVIAANSVVTKDVPPFAVVAGNPAKVKKFRFKEEICEVLNDLEWWNYEPSKISDLANYAIEEAVDCVKRLSIESKPYSPELMVFS